MIEPEMAFADLRRDIAAAEAYLKHCLQYILDHCQEDLDFFQEQYNADLKERLQVYFLDLLCKALAQLDL